MKKSLLFVTVVALVLSCVFVFTACISNMKNVSKKFEKKGYTVVTADYQNKDSNASYYDETVNWTLTATPNSNSGSVIGGVSDLLNTVTVTCYYKSDVAKTKYNNSSYKDYKDASDSEVCKYISGKVVVIGPKVGVKIAK
ncbi:MAG: hypothetical protein IJS93_00235 [Clostridia bacterium]|nr:hypothetical protein [Clostridia bacterium]